MSTSWFDELEAGSKEAQEQLERLESDLAIRDAEIARLREQVELARTREKETTSKLLDECTAARGAIAHLRAELDEARRERAEVTNLDAFCERCQIAYMQINYGMCPTCVMDKTNEALDEENRRIPAQEDRLKALATLLGRVKHAIENMNVEEAKAVLREIEARE